MHDDVAYQKFTRISRNELVRPIVGTYFAVITSKECYNYDANVFDRATVTTFADQNDP